MKRAGTYLLLLFTVLVFPATLGGAGEMRDGAPPRLLEWPMLPGESLSQLARLIYPRDVRMQRHFIDAAVRENPATFPRISPRHPFDQETLIWLPDLKALSRLAASTPSPRHYLHPALPAMQPGVAGARPSPLQMSTVIDGKPITAAEHATVQSGVKLMPAPAARHLNTLPVYDREAAKAIEAVTAHNQVLQQQQQALAEKIAVLEAGIARAREALSREQRRIVRRPVSPSPAVVDRTSTASDSLRSPSPLHLLTATGILLLGGLMAWRRRQRSGDVVAVPVTVPRQMAAADLGAPAAGVQIQENFSDDGLISVDEIASIVEEAKIFVALGRTEHAIEVLEDYITTHPRASAHPWLYLMEIYRSLQQRDAFEAVAKRFHKSMNVIAPQWEGSSQAMMVVPHSLEDFPHLLTRLTEGWGTLDAQDFLNALLQDNRGGERQGFSMEVLQEILLLLAILEMRDHLPSLKSF